MIFVFDTFEEEIVRLKYVTRCAFHKIPQDFRY